MSSEIRFVHSPYSFEGMVPVAAFPSFSDGLAPRNISPAPTRDTPRNSATAMAMTIRALQTQNQGHRPQVPSPPSILSLVAHPSAKPTNHVFAAAASDWPPMVVCSSPTNCQSPLLLSHSPFSPNGTCPSDTDTLNVSFNTLTPSPVSSHESLQLLRSPDSTPYSSPKTTTSVTPVFVGFGDEYQEVGTDVCCEDFHPDHEVHLQMGRQYHRGKALMLGCPCGHVAHWRRLRAKRGYSHFLCILCGNKWKKSKFVAF